MKKILALLLALCMMLSLVACGAAEEAPAAKPEAATPEVKEEKAEAAEEAVTLTVTSWFTEQAVGKIYEDTWQVAADALGYNVIVDHVDTETFKTKSKVMMASGEMSDITSMWGILTWLEPYITSGSVICVDDYINNSDVKYLDSARNPYYADGKQYLFPTTASQSYYMFYNKQIVEDLGLPMPVTMDDVYEIIEKCRAAGIEPFGLPVKDRWQADMLYEALVMREDPYAWDKVLSGELTYDSEPFLNAAYTAQQLVRDGAFPDDALNIGGADAREMFFAGRFAFFIDGGWRFTNLLDNMGDNLGYIAMPMFNGDESYKDFALTQAGYGLIIKSDCEYKDEAAKLCLKYVELIGEYLAEQGRVNIVETDTPAASEVNAEYAKMAEDTANVKKHNPTWVDNLPSEKAQVSYDLALELFGLMITPEEYVAQYAEMLAE